MRELTRNSFVLPIARPVTVAIGSTLVLLWAFSAIPALRSELPLSETALAAKAQKASVVKTYRAPNGNPYEIVLLKKGTYSFRKNAKTSSEKTFSSVSAVTKYLERNNPAKKNVPVPVKIPVSQKLDTTSRAS